MVGGHDEQGGGLPLQSLTGRLRGDAEGWGGVLTAVHCLLFTDWAYLIHPPTPPIKQCSTTPTTPLLPQQLLPLLLCYSYHSYCYATAAFCYCCYATPTTPTAMLLLPLLIIVSFLPALVPRTLTCVFVRVHVALHHHC